jgi:predicted metal-binding protein
VITASKIVSTPKHMLRLDFLLGFAPLDKISVRKEFFAGMCESGCRNYNQKYSCPPHSPDFSKVYKDKDCAGLVVVLLKLDLDQLSGQGYPDHHRLRLANAVIKPRLEAMMRKVEERFGEKFIASGACRLCKPCAKKLSGPCKHPGKMRFSLESLGVDCNKLCQDLFEMPLLWYKEKEAPKYTAVMCAIPLKDASLCDDVFAFIEEKIKE